MKIYPSTIARIPKIKKTKIIDREYKIKQYRNDSPSKLFYEPVTRNWFRKHYSTSLIKKSIYSLFPNNCEPVTNQQQSTPTSRLMEWLSKYLKPKDKYKNLWINPKYFFTKELYDKMWKWKDVFLQFDEDGSRKMEIDEMTTMFKANHINATEDELCNLLFKGKKYKKEDINKLYLDFYQFMTFAISKESDEDFRNFMRKMKERILKEREERKIINRENSVDSIGKVSQNNTSTMELNGNFNNYTFKNNNRSSKTDKDTNNNNNITSNKENNNTKQDNPDYLNIDEDDEPIFIPMNFNVLLDYFIHKGKERKNQKKWRRAIKSMKNILAPGTYPEDDKDFQPSEDDNEDGNDGENKVKDNWSNSNNCLSVKEKIAEEYDKQLKELNICDIVSAFGELVEQYKGTDGYTSVLNNQLKNVNQVHNYKSKTSTKQENSRLVDKSVYWNKKLLKRVNSTKEIPGNLSAVSSQISRWNNSEMIIMKDENRNTKRDRFKSMFFTKFCMKQIEIKEMKKLKAKNTEKSGSIFLEEVEMKKALQNNRGLNIMPYSSKSSCASRIKNNVFSSKYQSKVLFPKINYSMKVGNKIIISDFLKKSLANGKSSSRIWGSMSSKSSSILI